MLLQNMKIPLLILSTLVSFNMYSNDDPQGGLTLPNDPKARRQHFEEHVSRRSVIKDKPSTCALITCPTAISTSPLGISISIFEGIVRELRSGPRAHFSPERRPSRGAGIFESLRPAARSESLQSFEFRGFGFTVGGQECPPYGER
jgi:hypothetical protein